MTRSAVRDAAVCTALYVVAAAIMGRELLGGLTTRIIHDDMDPLLIAALLDWNTINIPFTDAWWQFPIFHPARDVLAFSEHLLGVSVIFAPFKWVLGDTVAAANLTSLATFPLCGLAAFALARHLTQSSLAAFVAGLVYAFGPYRMGQLAHVQMLAVQWAPVAILALHLYLKTGGTRWLALFGASWLMQALSNGYALFFLSVFAGLWVLWFVLVQGRWQTAVTIALVLAFACVPLAPILSKYVAVHARNGFSRSFVEARNYSADALGFLCAPFEVSVWGWLWGWLGRACVVEGELFPGLVTGLLFVAGFLLLRKEYGTGRSDRRWIVVLRVLAIAFASVQLASALAVAVGGPWNVEWGPLSAHAASAAKPLMLAAAALAVAFFTSSGFRASMTQASPLAFYLAATVFMWWTALGPDPKVGGEASGVPGPFLLFMQAPGFNGIRVPARFWVMGTLSMSMVVAFVVAALLRARRHAAPAVLTGALALGVLSDGWEQHMPTAAVPPGPPDPALLRGQAVLYLPAGNITDVRPTFYSVAQGWRAVNGYSGFEPNHYDGVRQASKFELDGLFTAFTESADLHVWVAEDAPRMREVVERQPGARRTNASATQYLVPSRSRTVAVPRGTVAKVVRVSSSCLPAEVLSDGDLEAIWTCAPQDGSETITLTLASAVRLSGLRLTQGRPVEFPRQLLIETSLDGASWTAARRGDVVPEFVRAALAAPTLPVLELTVEPQEARFIRLRQVGHDPTAAWSLREVEVIEAAR
jgi:hypothetical protein